MQQHPELQEGVTPTLVNLRNLDGNLHPLVVLDSREGVSYVLLKQIAEVFLAGRMSTKVLRDRVARGRRSSSLKQLGTLLRGQLQQMGGCDNRGKPPLCCSVACMTRALTRAKFPQQLVASLQACQRTAGAAAAEPSARPDQPSCSAPLVFAQTCAPRLPAQPVLIRQDQPLSLPALDPGLVQDRALQQHLEALHSFCTAPFVAGRSGGPLAASSWQLVHKELMMFLGYCHAYLKVCRPNLSHVVNADLVAQYLGSRVDCGITGGTLDKCMQSLKKVVLFWQMEEQGQQHLAQLQAVHAWLEELGPQLKAHLSGRARQVDFSALDEQSKWGDVGMLIKLFLSKRDLVLDICARVSALSTGQARDLHDALLACFMFGWLPPTRSRCIRTLTGPHSSGPCSEEGCTLRGCQGNRVHSVPGQPGKLRLHLPHHKTVKSRGVLSLELPQDLADMVTLYMQRGYPVLSQYYQSKGFRGPHPYMFINKLGGAFTDGAFSSYWKMLMQRWGGPVFGPHFLRHVFVGERMSSHSVAGPDHAGAAHCMSNSLPAWLKSYNQKTSNFQGQMAVNSMAEWRNNLLKGQGAAAAAVASAAPV